MLCVVSAGTIRPEASTCGDGYVVQGTLCRVQDHCSLQAVLLMLEFGEMHT